MHVVTGRSPGIRRVARPQATITSTTMFSKSLTLALSLAAPAAAYTKKDREDAIKWITEEKGFPHLAAFDKMTPKMLKTVMTNYLNLVSPDALEFLTPLDLEVIWTATRGR